MKFTKYITAVGAVAVLGLGLTSCNDWLDVNEDPNTPTNEAASYDKRLAHIQFYTNSAYQFATQPASFQCGIGTTNGRTGNAGKFCQWEMTEWRSTTCYQWWFVGAACNLKDYMESAEKAGAYHYLGTAYLIRAYGMILMNDLHGELPYSDALGSNVTPTYNTGKEMFELALQDIDKGLEYLQMTQKDGAKPLSANDSWANGDVSKWIKWGYLLKARQLNKLMKKGEGSYTNLKWDANEILACLDKAEQSNSDNMIMAHEDGGGTDRDVLGWSEPLDWNPLHSVIGSNGGYLLTRTVFDRLTNFDGKGIEDPRANCILPWARSQKGVDTPADIDGMKIKWSDDGKWRRSVGVDMVSKNTVRLSGGPYFTSWNSKEGHFYCDSKTRAGDTVYVDQESSSTRYESYDGQFYFKDGKSGGSGNELSRTTGCFFTRSDAPTYLGTYHEVCFIRAEVYFRQGNKAKAYECYKAGVKANMELMNQTLQKWSNKSKDLAACPAYQVMSQSDIDNYCNTALGTASDLTIGKIMTQKHIAMMYSVELMNDMRRYDYNPEVFMNWNIPAEYYVNSNAQLAVPMGKYPRRWRVSSHEYNYNTDNLNAIGEKVPGANVSSGNWWNEKDMWTINVWWDSDQE